MSTIVNAEFLKKDGFAGVLHGEDVSCNIGDMEGGGIYPYELLLGALCGCFYHTILGIINKMHLDFTRLLIKAEGERRDGDIQTLKDTKLILCFDGADTNNKDRYIRAAALAGQYCSIYQTISKVSDMHVEVNFK